MGKFAFALNNHAKATKKLAFATQNHAKATKKLAFALKNFRCNEQSDGGGKGK